MTYLTDFVSFHDYYDGWLTLLTLQAVSFFDSLCEFYQLLSCLTHSITFHNY